MTADDAVARALAISSTGSRPTLKGRRDGVVLAGKVHYPMGEDLLAGADVTLDDEVLDRIDQIAPPGTDAGPNDVAYTPLVISNVSLRRRPAADRSAA